MEAFDSLAPMFIELGKIISIFALSWFSFWPAMPAGLALGLHPLVIVATTTISYISGVVLVLFAGERVQIWLRQRFQSDMLSENKDDDSDTPPSFIKRFWQKYGVIGFGILAPMTTGAQIGAMLGLVFKIRRSNLLVWMSIGALLWAIILIGLALLGIESLDTLF